MNYFLKSKWLILIVALLFGISFSNCGKKKSGLLLLPDLVEGQGGPSISPENVRISQEETSTQAQAPSIQIVDDNGVGQTSTSDSSGTSDVIYLQQISADDSNNQNSGENTSSNIENNNQNTENNIVSINNDNNNSNNSSNNIGNTDNNNVSSNESNNNDRPITSETTVPLDKVETSINTTIEIPKEILPLPAEINEILNDTDTSKDPLEAVVISNQISNNNEATQQEESQEDTVANTETTADTEEQTEEQADVDDADDNDTVVVEQKEEVNLSKGKSKDELANKNCKISVKNIDTTQGRWFNTPEHLLPHPKQKNKSIKGMGIHTYWAYESLLVNVNSNCESGKYKLTIVAKNYGKLPDWYHFFNVKVVNNNTGENLGNMLIRASDERYHRGQLIVNLPKGNSVLNILWTNDAWEPNVYDANIQIKRIKINKFDAKEPKQILSRKGSDFCDTMGRWFVGANPPSAYTYWQNQTISYCFVTKQAGKYEISVKAGNAKNGLPLMPEYKEFKVLVAANGNSNYITIPAEQGKYNKGTTTLDLPEGNIILNVTWLNDLYQPPEYDANIEITRVKLKRVGDIESPISAFLLQNPNITYKLIIPGIILILGALGLIYWIRREKIA